MSRKVIVLVGLLGLALGLSPSLRPLPVASVPSESVEPKTLSTTAHATKARSRNVKNCHADIPRPQRAFEGEILDYRVVDLPPDGGVRHQRREWLIRRDGTPFCLTEESSGNEGFTTTVSPYVANRLYVDYPVTGDLGAFRRELEAQGCEVSEPIDVMKSGDQTECVRVTTAEISLNALDNLERAIAKSAGRLQTCRDYLFEAEDG